MPRIVNRKNLQRFGAALGIFLLLFITTAGLCHYHEKASDTCQVCHVAHAPVVQTHVISSIAAPLFIGWAFAQPEQSLGLAIVVHQASPRAPPAA
jgi:hypothetical protein